jgi:BON domain-containing protein
MTHISLYSLVPAILMLAWFVLSDDHPARIQPVAPNARTFVIYNLELERRIRTKLETDAALEGAIDVTAEAAKNEATLSGLVDSQAVRHRAIELAKSAHSGLTINDRIAVKPAT